MGNASSNATPKSRLSIQIDQIASKYILSQNYNDISKLSEKDHCDKLAILTAKVIDKNLTSLEQKEVLDRINKVDKSQEKIKVEEGDVLDEETQAGGTRAGTHMQAGGTRMQFGGEEEKNEIKDCVKIAKYYVKIAHLYAAIMKTVNPVIISTDDKGVNTKYDLSTKQTMPTTDEIKSIQYNNLCTMRINTLLQESDYNVTDPKNHLLTVQPRFCNVNKDPVTGKTRKFYEGTEKKKQLGGQPKNGNKKKKKEGKEKDKTGDYDEDDDDDDDEEEDNKKNNDNKKGDNNDENKKSKKNNDAEEEEEDDEEEEDEGENKGKKKKKNGNNEDGNGKKKEGEDKKKEGEEKKKEPEVVEKPIKETPLVIDSTEIGIPELMKLYYDVYDEEKGEFTKMSPEMIKIYQADVETFYKAFTGKEVETDENGNKKISKFEQITLKEFHKSDGCKPEGIYTKPYEGPLNAQFGKENLFEKYATHVNKMMNTMNDNQDKLLGIVKKLFKFKKPNKKKEEEKKKKEEEDKKKLEEEEKKKKEEEEKKKAAEPIVKVEEKPGAETAVSEKDVAGPNIIQGIGPIAAANNAPANVPVAAVGDVKPAAVGDVKPVPAVGDVKPAAVGDVKEVAVGDVKEVAADVKPEVAADVKPEVADTKPKAVTVDVKPEPIEQSAGAEPIEQSAGAGNTPDEIEDVTINPDLDEKLLDSLINSARKIIVNLYITCENDFIEGIHIFEAIVAAQLGKTTNSQINILNHMTLDYLAEHSEA